MGVGCLSATCQAGITAEENEAMPAEYDKIRTGPIHGAVRMRRIGCLILLVMLAGPLVHAGERITVAVLPPECLDTNKDSRDWQRILARLFEHKLREAKSLRILPSSSIHFAFRESKLTPGEALSTNQVQKLGEMVEAQRVVWWTYERKGGEWKVSAKSMIVATGKCSETPTRESTNWFMAASTVCGDLAKEMGATMSPEEAQRMDRPATVSAEALRLLKDAFNALYDGRSPPEIEADLRAAVRVDRRFVLAYCFLAEDLVWQGKNDESAEVGRQAVQAQPDSEQAHYALGYAYQAMGLDGIAREEFSEANRIDPDNPDNLVRFADASMDWGKFEEARTALKQAAALAPYDATIHAELAYNCRSLGDTEGAWSELKLAERYNDGGDSAVYQTLGQTYDLLNDTYNAEKNYELFLSAIPNFGDTMTGQYHTRLGELKASLVPHFVDAIAPQWFSPSELEQAFHARLSKDEYRLVTNPLVGTPKMKAWAESSAGTATNDLEKAQELFNAVLPHVNQQWGKGLRTAADVFNSLADARTVFTCQEYAFLYVATARQLGLKAYYTQVNEDYRGKPVTHGCAAVFIGSRAVLIDPMYRWFGVPHKKYEVLDDVQTVALYLSQTHDGRRIELAAKLSPDSPVILTDLAINLADRGNVKRAQVVADRAAKLDPTGWAPMLAEGYLEGVKENWAGAETYLKKCLALNPDAPEGHFLLGTALGNSGRWREAREEYRLYLQGETDPDMAEEARRRVAEIDAAPLNEVELFR
jgi:tetratricopeptide (TPR) repeat protein